ncbi:oxygen-dependent protoporphyrinogen oxidase [Friedmanniomyces endolithicus]|uniref:Protoporphyrinogen oxidase n=1 Tax=Friedmanniomyces endolithicus TaxID=329885 RepID=A0AAN6HDL0_9PEZI|nr:oxygen-dependent protoporphyrinogen oxidase [Friedmanniomyces endolithicus]KAK0272263.1 oxygen-dependent protoporphyrinogen oxidase [Friedmanniomyces endolithicus]KAK0274885.1 oxygen-dependent protoporphyrinogen oxidase [Friedmanniomyces endolithicus]KAK0323048.1 oxygen-dependent protoporphyrinogen oxidase [Friedmanniomyces endolithicus]KAK0909996.1 oxygen-dependent protoporphyrinogen oxidase [Friedmanniomyces endolithicus]
MLCCQAALHLRQTVLGLRLGLPPGLRSYSSDAEQTHNVAILGGGITGLASAYYLTKELPNVRVTIYEASDRIGGWLSSKRVPVKDGTVLFEAGPRTLRPNGNGVLSAKLLQELDLAKDAIFAQNTSPAARNRYVYYPDHLVRMPHPSVGIADNLWSLFTEPVFSGTPWGIVSEFFKPQRDPSVQDESVGDFFSRRIGRNAVDRLLSGVLHGIYAGDAWQLSAKSLFPVQWRDEAETGGIMAGVVKMQADGRRVTKHEGDFLLEAKKFRWDPLLKATLKDNTAFTLKDGLQGLVDGLARHLFAKGNVEFKTSSPVSSVKLTRAGIEVTAQGSEQSKSYRHAISALSPSHLNQVAKDPSSDSNVASLVPIIPSVTVMTVNLYYRTPDLHLPGFGYLIPQATPFESNPERALGVVFDSAYSPSPRDLDLANWQITDTQLLQQAREKGQLINVNDFAWYNMPDRPNAQDDVKERGTKLTVMLGGHWWNEWPSFPDEQQGLALAKSVLQRHLNITEEPEAYQVNVQEDCIPQYTVGHEDRLKKAHNKIWNEYKGRLRVAGNWMSGVGVNDCLRSAWDVVRSIRDGRDGTGLEQVGTTSAAWGGSEGGGARYDVVDGDVYIEEDIKSTATRSIACGPWYMYVARESVMALVQARLRHVEFEEQRAAAGTMETSHPANPCTATISSPLQRTRTVPSIDDFKAVR